MNILLYKDGRLLIDDGNPMENVNFDGMVMYLLDPVEGDTLVYDGSAWTNGAPAPVLYANEGAGDDDAVVLDKTYAQISTAVTDNRAVYIASVSEGTTTLVPLASFGGSDETGYTVTAGSDTYTAETADGVLTKQAAAGGEG